MAVLVERERRVVMPLRGLLDRLVVEQVDEGRDDHIMGLDRPSLPHRESFGVPPESLRGQAQEALADRLACCLDGAAGDIRLPRGGMAPTVDPQHDRHPPRGPDRRHAASRARAAARRAARAPRRSASRRRNAALGMQVVCRIEPVAHRELERRAQFAVRQSRRLDARRDVPNGPIHERDAYAVSVVVRGRKHPTQRVVAVTACELLRRKARTGGPAREPHLLDPLALVQRRLKRRRKQRVGWDRPTPAGPAHAGLAAERQQQSG